jgi:hypothetical protein
MELILLTYVTQMSKLPSSMKMSKSDLRKEAYRYIQERLSKLPASSGDVVQYITISLEELRMLQKGMADPSETLVTTLKQLFKGVVTETEIDAQLVLPFERHK